MSTQTQTQSAVNLNHSRVTRVGNTVFVPLPRALWRSCGRCDCAHCQGREGFWDTLALPAEATESRHDDTTWTVHAPEYHPLSARS